MGDNVVGALEVDALADVGLDEVFAAVDGCTVVVGRFVACVVGECVLLVTGVAVETCGDEVFFGPLTGGTVVVVVVVGEFATGVFPPSCSL